MTAINTHTISYRIANMRPLLMRFALSLTHNMDEAEDLAQEAMLRAISRQDTFRPGSDLTAWLYVILRNLFINGFRKAKRYRICSIALPDWYMTCQSLAIDTLEYQDQMRRVNTLSSRESETIILYAQGYRYEEISTITRAPEGTVKSRIHLARKKLKGRHHE